MRSDKETISKTKKMSRDEVEEYFKKLKIDYWFPEDITCPDDSKTILVAVNS